MNKKNITQDKIAKYIIKYPDLSDSQIALKLNINRNKVWRTRRLTKELKFSKKKANDTGTALTYEGYDGIKQEIQDKKTEKKIRRVIHAGGPIHGTNSKIFPALFGENQYNEDIINHWKPHMQLVVNDEHTGKPLSASAITYKRNSEKNWYPRYFSNPMQSLNYQTFEAHTRSTIGGPFIRTGIATYRFRIKFSR